MVRKIALSLLFYVYAIRLFRRVRFFGKAIIYRSREASILWGKGISVNSDCYANLFGLFQPAIFVARDNGKIEIGNNVGISGTTIYARKGIQIGDNTIIGANCKIVDNDFHAVCPEHRIDRESQKNNIECREVRIGKNCFIGANSIILKGAIIADNSVVGAGSVVTKQFTEPRIMLAGNPARMIKRL
ncbi:MAG: acyltransferase [Deltaproteobacteria bacterium]|nr:acyltransferase [Deltaproteobacteria bacterium]